MTGEITDWAKAQHAAVSCGKSPVLYCVDFSHGLMKLGATTDMHNRLLGLTSHGLFRSMVKSVVVEKCERHYLFAAEKVARKMMAGHSTVRGPEIFDSCDEETVRAVLVSAVATCSDTPAPRTITEADFHEIAIDSGMYYTFSHIAMGRAVTSVAIEVIDYMENREAVDLFEWERVYRRLSPLVYGAIAPLIQRNGVLISRGVGYEDRKTILEQYALDLRSEGPKLLK